MTELFLTLWLQQIKTLTAEIKELYLDSEKDFLIGWSGGKDSSTVLQLVWRAVLQIPVEQRRKTIYVISTDTRVENPVVAAWVRDSHQKMREAAAAQQMPVEPHLLYPDLKDTFWVNLIGKGYPAPRHKFRWCTERLKIHPANQFIRDKVRENGETILILGTRKAESAKRAATMKKHQQGRVRDRLSPNASLPNSLIYSPIEDWDNNQVWLYLHETENPWGQSNDDLFQLYRGATADNECPLVVDTSTPSCGDSRFGCWVCTLVDKDKSMQAMILNDQEKAWMEPLLEFRDLLDFRSDQKREQERQNRDFRRLSGHVQLFERANKESGRPEVAHIPGPYLKHWRQELLRRLLQAQQTARANAPDRAKNLELINLYELSEIRRIWLEDKHEFEDALPRIYEEVLGEPFPDPRPGAGQSLLGPDEWEILADVCQDDPIQLELLAKLLDTERQYQLKSNRKGVYEALETCFETSSRDQENALNQARFQREVRAKAKDGDAQGLEKLLEAGAANWGQIKFAPPKTDPLPLLPDFP
ncbi:MAG: DNA phosphorothioation system sulfurtransferase DndC [Cyanobacteria bacterium RI_101]|nr:DNA phosphorothioation system sulfurtransferase DndC [Cyanobacteria bacterium RI_101]